MGPVYLESCPFDPGSDECGASNSGAFGCDGMFWTCCKYGNQERFGGSIAESEDAEYYSPPEKTICNMLKL